MANTTSCRLRSRSNLRGVLGAAIAVAAAAGTVAIADHHAEHAGKSHQIVEGVTGMSLLGADAEMSPEAMSEMMAAYMKLNSPSDGHKVLKPFEGEWDVKQTIMMPGSPEMTIDATASNKLVMGGKYIVTEYSGSMMGVPYTGMGIMGYNNHRKQFFQVWVDSMGTAPWLSHGSLSQDGSTITLIGEMDEPMTGEIGKSSMWTTRMTGPDTFVAEAKEILYGEPFTVMRLEYTRKAAAAPQTERGTGGGGFGGRGAGGNTGGGGFGRR